MEINPESDTKSTISGRLAGKVAVVTGASSGIGRAIALSFSEQGATVTCVDLTPNARSEVQEETDVTTHDCIKQRGGKAMFVGTDVTKSDQVEQMVKDVIGTFGRIDMLVNNAGIAMESRAALRLHETPEATWDKTLDVNAKSVFLVSKFVIKQMLAQEPSTSGARGSIINMSSIFGLVGGTTVVSYSASKGAVSLLTMTTANEYAKDGIRCNAICPGHTKTAIFANTVQNQLPMDWFDEHYPMGLGRPDDIAGMAVFLASDEARWMTGARIPVDGGFTSQ